MIQKKLNQLTKAGWRKKATYDLSKCPGGPKKRDEARMRFKRWKARGFK